MEYKGKVREFKFASIREELNSSLIVGIIGATQPNHEYSTDRGFIVGQQVREFMDSRVGGRLNGKIFTGGVEGVGVDAFMGVVAATMSNEDWSSKFFVLIPHNTFTMDPLAAFSFNKKSKMMVKTPYKIPRAYSNIAKLLHLDQCEEVRAGEDMSERREYVAGISDVLVMVNGSGGTLDEAANALKCKVPVIAVANTGGMTKTLIDKKNGVSPTSEGEFDDDFLGDYTIDTNLIHIVKDEWEVKHKLLELFK